MISVRVISTIVLSAVLTMICLFTAPYMLNVIKVSRQIYDEALIYLQVYFTGLVFTFTYNMISSVFRALGDSKTPLVFLAVSSVLNVILALDINTIIAFIIAVIIFAAPRQLMYIFLATNTAREVFFHHRF